MGLDERWKKLRDKRRFERYGGVKLVEELILRLPEKGRYKKGHVLNVALLIAKEKMGRSKGKRKFFLAETILRNAVGRGYLAPVGDRYSLTRKSRKLRRAQAPEPAPSP